MISDFICNGTANKSKSIKTTIKDKVLMPFLVQSAPENHVHSNANEDHKQ